MAPGHAALAGRRTHHHWPKRCVDKLRMTSRSKHLIGAAAIYEGSAGVLGCLDECLFFKHRLPVAFSRVFGAEQSAYVWRGSALPKLRDQASRAAGGDGMDLVLEGRGPYNGLGAARTRSPDLSENRASRRPAESFGEPIASKPHSARRGIPSTRGKKASSNVRFTKR